MTQTFTREPRRLGASTLGVFPIGLGCMSLSGAYGKSDDAEGMRVIHHAIDRGITLLDSSDMYGWGHNETLLGKALAGGRRAGLVLATKFGQTQRPGGANGVDGRPEYVKAACEASLGRLGVEVIDLYYQHRVDPAVPIEETVGAMGELVTAGKVRALGLSEARPETIRRAHETFPIAAVQSEYSLLYREQAEETLQTTRELGISFVAYSPLGRSLLTGSVRHASDIPEGDGRGRHPRFAKDNLARNLELVSAVEAMAKAKGCTPGQVALAWLLAQGPDIVPIPGTKRVDRVDQNLGALDVALSPDDVAALSAALPPGAAAGTRYAEAQLKAVYL
ncbi:aldo/keto reductase [Enhydrobacter sp.]|jgi:aryl-alcohol dehydrogenase-like predicted oxidoreductase|uniref:aldo/keto reductase n=1 Tax=Enhydrobacter sp. TaxID=1894999 RepID=UPI00263932CC|nr:aldo/keto reductase [Enhydrobacter sp.]WIM12059.1 MAG: Oxidoreductase, aldo/keto reductase family [Enhydrobacter sp.]